MDQKLKKLTKNEKRDSQQEVWVPGSADTVCSRRPLITQVQRLITWPCDLDLWPWRPWHLWLMRVIVLHPYTKFKVCIPCRSEDMALDVCEH